MTSPNVVFSFYTIELAFEYASSCDYSNSAYLDRHTGKTLFFSTIDSDDEPDDFDYTTRYLAIPNKRVLGLGSQIAIEFAAEIAPSLLDDVRETFRRRGGFRRFKDLLDRHKLLDTWHDYEAERERAAIIQWCAENDIRYTMEFLSGE